MRPLLLLLGEDPSRLDSLYRILKCDERDIVRARDSAEATLLLQRERVSLCLQVLSPDDPQPLRWLRARRREHPQLHCVLLAAQPSVSLAVEAMQSGARDFLALPCSPAHLSRVVTLALSSPADAIESPAVEPALDRPPIVGTSNAIRDILDLVARVGPSAATVLLEGESGTGKELIAHAIQQCSTRRQAPFVRVNCAALPETLMESELFGHERGAFTGAVRARAGRFELADTGTLFLDEIGDMSLNTQTKLLRVLQEGEFDRVGGTQTQRVDVRVIAATNVDLQQAVRDKRFREDLYYRLRVVQLRVPPLRERRSDIPLLAEAFRQRFAQRDGKDIPRLETDALRCLQEYDWPGNVRELENAIERAVALTSSGVSLQRTGLPPELQQQPRRREVTFRIGTSIADIERRMIAETLRYTDGDKTQAARLLGITVRTIYRRLERRRAELQRWAANDDAHTSHDAQPTSTDADALDATTAGDGGRLDTRHGAGS